MAKQRLDVARRDMFNEFFTRLEDIEIELEHYDRHFKGKVVFCNCDDPKQSNFWKHLRTHFKRLKMKKLIATSFTNVPNYAYFYDGKREWKEKLRDDEESLIPAERTGDFRSAQCIKYLQEADLIVTNPPFSLFREYMAQLVKYKKKFLIIGSLNSVFFKEISPLIENGKIWLGTKQKYYMKLIVPKQFVLKNKNFNYDEKGNAIANVSMVMWFTNLSHKQRNQELRLGKKYKKEDYPKYDNYNAIEVGEVKNIPRDYYKPMGVPITFLSKHNPKQFEIIAFSAGLGLKSPDGKNTDGFFLNGKKKFARMLIRRIKK